jgi:hypothetical protein
MQPMTRKHMLKVSLWIAALVVAGATGLLLPPARGEDGAKTVRLTIDYGDGVEKTFATLAWQDKLTVLGALEAAAKHPRGIKFKHRGSGASAFVTAIDDLTNEGRGRNWTYQVNGKRADKSSGVWELKAGDTVVWRYGE